MNRRHRSEPKAQLLMVENNPGDVNLVSLVLNHRRDLEIHTVENVVLAYQFLQKRDRFVDAPTPDLIFLDLNLPIYSGKMFLEERRSQLLWRSIPVVVFTSSWVDQNECIALGANDYVIKPTDWRQWNLILDKVISHFLCREHSSSTV